MIGNIVKICTLAPQHPEVGEVADGSTPLDDLLDDPICHWGDRTAFVSADGSYVTSHFSLTGAERDLMRSVI